MTVLALKLVSWAISTCGDREAIHMYSVIHSGFKKCDLVKSKAIQNNCYLINANQESESKS